MRLERRGVEQLHDRGLDARSTTIDGRGARRRLDVANDALTVDDAAARRAGAACSVASTMTPSVPSEPIISAVRS